MQVGTDDEGIDSVELNIQEEDIPRFLLEAVTEIKRGTE